MKFSYTPDKSDYIKNIRYLYLRNDFLILTIFLLAIIAGGCFAFVRYGLNFGISLLVIIPIIILIYLFIIFPFIFGNQFEKDKRLRSKTIWDVTDHEIIMQTEFGETTSNWNIFRDFIETKEYFLLFNHNQALNIIPKRTFTEFQEEDFRQLLEKNVKKLQFNSIVFNRRSIVIFVILIINIILLLVVRIK